MDTDIGLLQPQIEKTDISSPKMCTKTSMLKACLTSTKKRLPVAAMQKHVVVTAQLQSTIRRQQIGSRADVQIAAIGHAVSGSEAVSRSLRPSLDINEEGDGVLLLPSACIVTAVRNSGVFAAAGRLQEVWRVG